MIYKQGDIKDLYRGNVKAKEFYKGSQLLYSADKSLVIYDNGVENVPFVVQESSNFWTFSKQSATLRIDFSSSAYSYGIIYTNISLELTGFKTLNIDWSASELAYNESGVYFFATKNVYNYYPSGSEPNLMVQTSFNRRVDSIDIDASTGNFYIKLTSEHIYRSGAIIIHKIWLE